MGILSEKVTQVLWSQSIEGFENHCLRLISDKLINGFPSQAINKRSAWGIVAAISYNSSSSVLKLLQLLNFSSACAAPNRATVAKMGLHNARVESFQSFLW